MKWQRIAVGAMAAGLLAACGGGSGSGSAAPAPTPSGAASAAAGATVKLLDYSLSPSGISIPAGGSIQVVNTGKSTHNLWIRDSSGKTIAKTSELQPGASATLTVPGTAGSYTMYCQEPGHESLGMKGTLTVT